MIARLLQRVLGRRGSTVTVPTQVPAPTPRRVVEIDPMSPVRVSDNTAERIIEASRGNRDPLGFRNEAPGNGDETRITRVAILARAALEGCLPIPPHHRRMPMHPVTGAMLDMAGIDADAFAAIGELRVGGGLYIDGPKGRTIAKALGNQLHPDDHTTPQHVRVRVQAENARPRLTWWHEGDDRFLLSLPRLPATLGVALIGQPLSRLITDPAAGRHGLVIVDVADTEEQDEPRTLVTLREDVLELAMADEMPAD